MTGILKVSDLQTVSQWLRVGKITLKLLDQIPNADITPFAAGKISKAFDGNIDKNVNLFLFEKNSIVRDVAHMYEDECEQMLLNLIEVH